jgi:hypothetical protein
VGWRKRGCNSASKALPTSPLIGWLKRQYLRARGSASSGARVRFKSSPANLAGGTYWGQKRQEIPSLRTITPPEGIGDRVPTRVSPANGFGSYNAQLKVEPVSPLKPPNGCVFIRPVRLKTAERTTAPARLESPHRLAVVVSVGENVTIVHEGQEVVVHPNAHESIASDGGKTLWCIDEKDIAAIIKPGSWYIEPNSRTDR